MPPTVNARIPLSLLEAVRRMDTPETDTEEEEYVQELRNKRLGLSDTVYQQIRRYSDAAKRGQAIPYGEATGLGTLIGRRADAEHIFDSAGKILANDVYEAISGAVRKTIRLMPGVVARPLALNQIRQFAGRFFWRHSNAQRKLTRPQHHRLSHGEQRAGLCGMHVLRISPQRAAASPDERRCNCRSRVLSPERRQEL